MISSELDIPTQGDAKSHVSDHKRIIIRPKSLGGDRSSGYSNRELAT
jgi:hypothetical protein